MKNQTQRTKLLALGVFAFFLLNFPFLSLISNNQFLAGVPLLYAALFIEWILFLLVLIFILKYKPKNDGKS